MAEATNAAYNCIAMFERLSMCNSNDVNSLQNMLVNKLPESMREHKDRLHDLLLANKVSPVIELIVYTVPSVVSLITVALDCAQRLSAPSPSLVANAAICNTRQHALPKCHCCGKTGHMSSACPTTCQACI